MIALVRSELTGLRTLRSTAYAAAGLLLITLLTAGLAQSFDIRPRIAMLSFSNFGSVRRPETEKEIARTARRGLL